MIVYFKFTPHDSSPIKEYIHSTFILLIINNFNHALKLK